MHHCVNPLLTTLKTCGKLRLFMTQKTGALVLSLDFELHWGIRDQFPIDGAYTKHLEGARTAIPKLLELFAEFDVAATWATVGFLFARSREELEAHSPKVKPVYSNSKLDAYAEPLGDSETDAPLQYAPSLIKLITESPKQELSTHTFCHYYCLEDGQTVKSFQADLQSTISIAQTWGVTPKSIIFPRNQMNPAYTQIMQELGISIYRGNEPSWIYAASTTDQQGLLKRGLRLADSYLPVTKHHLGDWAKLKEANGLINIPSSRILRAYSSKLARLEPLRLKRITSGIELAAKEGKLYHLWWHPHNFGMQQDENLAFLRRILESFATYRNEYGMQSLSMLGVADQLDD